MAKLKSALELYCRVQDVTQGIFRTTLVIPSCTYSYHQSTVGTQTIQSYTDSTPVIQSYNVPQ